MPTPDTSDSPYQEALAFIQANPGCGSSLGMAKLVLSLWNSDCCFSYRECISAFDLSRLRLAMRLMQEFTAHGETQELCSVGHTVNRLYPVLWDYGQAGTEAKRALRASLDAAWRAGQPDEDD